MDIEDISDFGLISSPESGTATHFPQFILETKIEEIFLAMDLDNLNVDDLCFNDKPGSFNSKQ